MHRSGTSLLGGILQRLGIELPGDIIGDQHNPDGYFEWDAVVALQERLLIDLQRWWPHQMALCRACVGCSMRCPSGLSPAPLSGVRRDA